MLVYISGMSKEPDSIRSFLNRAFNKVRGSAKEISNDTVRDVKEIRDKTILPIVRYGNNRIASAAAGGKVGFLLGISPVPYITVPIGVVAGTAIGFFGGPSAAKKLEEWMGKEEEAKDASNDNPAPEQDVAPKVEDEPKAEDESDNKPPSPPPFMPK